MMKWRWPFSRVDARAVNVQHLPLDNGEGIARRWGERQLVDSEPVFSAVTLLSNTMASMRLKLYHGWNEETHHPMHKLLCYRPNPRMTPFEFWQTMEACRATYGNCYALKVPGSGGSIAALDVLDPCRVTPRRDTETGDIWYELRPDDGGCLYVHRNQMLHARHISTGGDKGISPLEVLDDTLKYDEQMRTFSLQQVKGISGAVVLEIPADMGSARKQEVIDDFMANYRRSASSLLILTGGAKATAINRSAVDAKVLDVDKITAGKVARTYSIPPALLGDYSKAGYNSQEQQQLEFLERTMMPIKRMYEDMLDGGTLTYGELQDGWKWRFDVDDLVVADSLTRAQVQQIQVRSGLRSPDEVRARDGFGPGPGGSRLYGSRDLCPLDQLPSQ